MNCELNLVPLSCDRQGVGFTSHPLSEDSNRLRLMKGHAKHFPVLEGQQYFYIKIHGCKGCCETAKVIGIEEDTFILDRTTSAKCSCILSNAQVVYLWDDIRVVQDIANSIGINVLSPLKYDACTRTLSVDCKELFAADCGGCGCGEGVPKDNGQGSGTPGLRGEKGEKGDAGVGLSSMKVSPAGQLMYTLTDGSTRSAGTLPVGKGAKGDQGPRGEVGAKGDKGDPGVGISTVKVNEAGTEATLTMTNGSTTKFDTTPLKGATGATGAKGDKGDKGDTGYSFQYIEVGNQAYIYGQPNTAVTLSSPSLNGMTFGPYTTNAEGLISFTKPTINGQVLMQIKQGNKLVGIGRSN